MSHGGFNFDSQPRVLRIEVESALFFKGLLGKSSTPTFSRQDVSRTLPPTFANSKASEHTFNQNKPTGSAYRKFKRPFRAVCWVGGGRASPVLGTDRTSVSGISTSRGRAAAQCVAISHRIPAQGRAQPCGVVAASDRTLAWLPAVWPAPHHAAGGGARGAGR